MEKMTQVTSHNNVGRKIDSGRGKNVLREKPVKSLKGNSALLAGALVDRGSNLTFLDHGDQLWEKVSGDDGDPVRQPQVIYGAQDRQ